MALQNFGGSGAIPSARSCRSSPASLNALRKEMCVYIYIYTRCKRNGRNAVRCGCGCADVQVGLDGVGACHHTRKHGTYTPICFAQALEGLEPLDPLGHGPLRGLARHPAADLVLLAAATTPLTTGAVTPSALPLAPVELIFPVGIIILQRPGRPTKK